MNVRGWMMRLKAAAADARPTPACRRGGAVAGDDRQVPLLYEYLEHRHANTVVLTFAEVEDLLGFPLPEQARRHREWWTDADASMAGAPHSDAWILASRTAVPNLSAQTVVFDRAS